jgi:hypothetical protein
LKGGNAGDDFFALFITSEINSLGGTVGFDEMIAMVMKGVPGNQCGELAHDPIPLDDKPVSLSIGHHPAAPNDVHRLEAVVMDSDIINELVGAVLGRTIRWHMLDTIDVYP